VRHLIDILDFSVEEIDGLITVANDMIAAPWKYADAARGKILGTLFFEPSTRTRLSFTSAMMSLGGNVLGFSQANSSSVSKGETVADTVRMVSVYSDIIVMRHPKEGAPIVASSVSRVPIINAGDGGHFHPTQTLTDILTISRKCGRLSDLTVGICGDLKYGRTVHSLIAAMARYENIKFVFISPEELKMPSYITEGLAGKAEYRECRDLEEALPELDILYMTRIQAERFDNREDYERLKDSYVLSRDKLSAAKESLAIMHPLPRVTEIATDVDDDPRAAYFDQAEYGRYIRMALILKLLASKSELRRSRLADATEDPALICKNSHCISSVERGIRPLFAGGRCAYCDQRAKKR
jgi:aspartate carbamoyltransferase catalytic subunit